MDFSKRLISDIRALLWVVTVGGLLLAWYCVRMDYAGALPWLTVPLASPGLPTAPSAPSISIWRSLTTSRAGLRLKQQKRHGTRKVQRYNKVIEIESENRFYRA